ncbi:adenylyl cyclase [Diaminobutyricimonas aerilata]|uniref:adenylyl cyclase n=1 Tax=Diaminobutyricimonas aerilata TaxID=1162967 RepID=UPI000C24BFC8|nr:adenylyl cyclase [Diaminobutyricimonas aerilata]
MIAGALLAGAINLGTGDVAYAAEPDLGPNVIVFDPSMPVEEINSTLAGISGEAEFSQNRHAVFFKPGTYGDASGEDDPATATGIVNAELGYYTAISGLGASPEDVRINGALHVEPVRACEANPWDCPQPGSLTRFWRSLSNMTINPIQRPVGVDADRPFPSGITDPHTMRYAVSQAAPLRRMNIEGNLTLFGRVGEYASGGYLANSNVDGTLISGSQQQWFTRDSTVGTWDGGVWNTVFSGVEGAPATDFGQPVGSGTGNKTTLETTPITREAPYLYIDDAGHYRVFVPAARTETRGHDWSTDADAGDSLPLEDFFIVKEGATAAQINAQLAAGKHLLITPGVYHLDAALHVDRAETVVLGLGYASLVPTAGDAAIEVGDVPGVTIAGITVDAGEQRSDVLVQVGPRGATAADPADPTTLSDVFIRVGGAWAGTATTSIEVNSPHTLLDHIWAWRADHGAGVAWDSNVGDHGLVVNGDDVTALGLFVEHYQKTQVQWNGERGRTVFYQSELPYDPPSQAAWMDGDRLGYASYRVADDVRHHLAEGLGVYAYFERGIDIRLESGIQAPRSPDVRFRSMTSVFLNGSGGIDHIINDAGATAEAPSGTSRQLVSYPPADTAAPTVRIDADPAAPGADGVYTRAVTLTVSGTDDFTPPPTLEVAVDGAAWAPVGEPLVLGDGAHTVEARATDSSGNRSTVARWSGTIRIAPVHDVPLEVSAHTQCLDGKAYIVASAVNRSGLAADIRLTSEEGTVKFTRVAPDDTVTYIWKASKRVPAGSATIAGYTWKDGQGKYSSYQVDYRATDCGKK